MYFRLRPSSLVSRSAFWAGLVWGLAVARPALRAADVEPVARAAALVEPKAEELRRLANAAEVELWLARVIPVGFTLAEAPEFFEAADEVFVNEQEGFVIFSYGSAEAGRWIAWVAFDAERTGVVQTAAIDLER